PSSLVPLAAQCELPLTLKYIARRLTEDIEKNPDPLNSLLDLRQTKSTDFSRQVVDGMSEALTGWRKAPKPAAWNAFVERFSQSELTALSAKVRNLNVLFGDGRALEEVRKVVLDQTLDFSLRKSALQTLIDARAPGLRDLCEQMLNVQFVNSVAARGLSGFSDPAAGVKLVKAYRQFHPSERSQLMSTLVSRAPFASALLDAIGEGRIPRSELSAFHARQIRILNDPAVTQKLTEVWGEFRESPQQNQQAIAKWKSQFTAANLATANLSQGRSTFMLACAPCHTLYGEGGKIGPDLTGASRDNLDYLLENIVDPSAVVSADFRMSVVKTKDGRVLNGIIAAKTERTITLKTMTETMSIERADVESAERSSISLMPEGLLDTLGATLARDLIGYLMHETQVPLPAEGKIARNPK
ncbi:MAG: Cytochrome c, partial [Verrucomicrobiales bacterium]|nr:Cytochrome c [Verrucomicrobiales bacterium]